MTTFTNTPLWGIMKWTLPVQLTGLHLHRHPGTDLCKVVKGMASSPAVCWCFGDWTLVSRHHTQLFGENQGKPRPGRSSCGQSCCNHHNTGKPLRHGMHSSMHTYFNTSTLLVKQRFFFFLSLKHQAQVGRVVFSRRLIWVLPRVSALSAASNGWELNWIG